jgi:hypothetical protein
MSRSQPLLYACGLFRRKGFAPRVRRRRGQKHQAFAGTLGFEQCERRLALDATDGSDGGFLDVVVEAHGGSGAGIVLDAGTGVPSGITRVTQPNDLVITHPSSITWDEVPRWNLGGGNLSVLPGGLIDSADITYYYGSSGHSSTESAAITTAGDSPDGLTSDSLSARWWNDFSLSSGSSINTSTFTEILPRSQPIAGNHLAGIVSATTQEFTGRPASDSTPPSSSVSTSATSGPGDTTFFLEMSAGTAVAGIDGAAPESIYRPVSDLAPPSPDNPEGKKSYTGNPNTSLASDQHESDSQNQQEIDNPLANSKSGAGADSDEQFIDEANVSQHDDKRLASRLIAPAHGENLALRGPSFEVAVLSPDQISDGGFLSLPEVVAQTRSIEQSHFAALAFNTPQQNPLFEDADSRLSINPAPDVARASVFEVAAFGSVFAAPEKLMRSPGETAEDPSAAAKAPAAEEFGLQTPTRTRKQDHHYVSTAMEAALTAVFAVGIFWVDESLRSASSISNQQRDARSAQKRRPW